MSSDAYQLLDASQFSDALDRLAGRIVAQVDDPVLVGILRRGVPIAEQLAERIESLTDHTPECGELELKRYTDDLDIISERPELDDDPFDVDVDGRTVLLVDDVLYSGRTMFRAAGFLNARGAETIHPAVVCSRGPNDMPIHAHFVAMQLDVRTPNIIEVHAPPYEDGWGVQLRKQPDD
jgi:pyrimidine operon attenuation protein/uracil phosphoribosyltransferase